MGNELAPKETFEEAIKSRLREDVGKLIPDEVLTQMVTKAINDMFFTKVQTANGYGTGPSWFEKHVQDCLQSRVHEVVSKYMLDQKENLEHVVTACLAEKSPQIMANVLMSTLTNTSHNLSWSIEQFILSKLNQHR